MKKLLFCIENFQHGGINRALINLINNVDKNKVEIKIFVVNQEKGPYSDVFKNFLYLGENKLLYWLSTPYFKHKGLKKYSLVGIKALRKGLTKSLNFDLFNYSLSKVAKKIENSNFDYIVAYAEGYITEFVSKINSPKIAWIHLDYKRYCETYNHKPEKEIYSKFDHIITPGKSSAKSFKQICPELADKVTVLLNFLDTEQIKNAALSPIILEKEKLSIISVGRICYEKRFFEIPEIALKAKELGADFKWYILGDGSDKEKGLLIENIKKFNVEDKIEILGFKDNPYPYIKNCDLLVCLSFSETFCYAIFEAKTLGIPVFSVPFDGIENILNENEGIVDELSSLPDLIKRISDNPQELKTYNETLKKYNYNNKTIADKFYNLIQG